LPGDLGATVMGLSLREALNTWVINRNLCFGLRCFRWRSSD